MSLIDGVGDEVVHFVVAVLLLAVAALAWWSTNARPDRYRTVLVMRSRTHHPVTVSIRTGPNLMISNTQASSNTEVSTMDANVSTITTESVVEDPRETRMIPLQEMDSIVDADMAMLDNHRMHFFRRVESPVSDTFLEVEEISELSDDEPASTEQIREMDSIVSAMEADNPCEAFRTETNRNVPSTADKATNKSDDNKPDDASVSNVPMNKGEDKQTVGDGDQGTSNTERILIKLKYLNDTLKEVDGCLDELLKDFKTRHFSTELSSEHRVRLIFNGRVLLDDAATLRACGLHDRCVVHCLVHPRQHNQVVVGGEPAPIARTELVTEGAAPERAWDLENVLMTLVSVALTVVWFFRCEYSNMFTASASVALFGLTVFYSVAIFGLYLSDTFHFDRRPQRAQPVPDN